MTIFEILSWIATTLSIAMFAPQTYKVLKTKKVDDLSFTTFLIMLIGCMGWSIYGSLVESYPASITNMVITLLLLPILYFIINDLKKFLIILFADIAVIIVTIILFVLNLEVHKVIKIIAVIAAGSASGFGFVPQIIKTVKLREYNDGSWLTILLIIISNGVWLTYWIDIDMHASDSDLPSNILATVFTASTLTCQIPLSIYKYYGGKK